jgi:hypothetical protein
MHALLFVMMTLAKRSRGGEYARSADPEESLREMNAG